jgi:hypothetical protein
MSPVVAGPGVMGCCHPFAACSGGMMGLPLLVSGVNQRGDHAVLAGLGVLTCPTRADRFGVVAIHAASVCLSGWVSRARTWWSRRA